MDITTLLPRKINGERRTVHQNEKTKKINQKIFELFGVEIENFDSLPQDVFRIFFRILDEISDNIAMGRLLTIVNIMIKNGLGPNMELRQIEAMSESELIRIVLQNVKEVIEIYASHDVQIEKRKKVENFSLSYKNATGFSGCIIL